MHPSPSSRPALWKEFIATYRNTLTSKTCGNYKSCITDPSRLKARIRLLGQHLRLHRVDNIHHAIQSPRDMITAESTINRAAISLRVISSTQGRIPVTYFVIRAQMVSRRQPCNSPRGLLITALGLFVCRLLSVTVVLSMLLSTMGMMKTRYLDYGVPRRIVF